MNIKISNCTFGNNLFSKNGRKVENEEEIRQLAKDVVRMANCNHPMLEDTYLRFVDAGEKYASFAQLALKKAEYDFYIDTAKDYRDNVLSNQEFLSKYRNTSSTLSSLDRSQVGMRLYNSMKTQWFRDNPYDENRAFDSEYNKKYYEAAKNAKDVVLKRIAILAGLTEGSKTLLPCSVGKGFKKWTYRFLRLVNR